MSIHIGPTPKHYLVLKRHGKWCAKSVGRFGLSYSSQAKAMSATIEKAEKQAVCGHEVIVSLFIRGSAPQIIWPSPMPAPHRAVTGDARASTS